jgi:hypothetical protein
MMRTTKDEKENYVCRWFFSSLQKAAVCVLVVFLDHLLAMARKGQPSWVNPCT